MTPPLRLPYVNNLDRKDDATLVPVSTGPGVDTLVARFVERCGVK